MGNQTPVSHNLGEHRTARPSRHLTTVKFTLHLAIVTVLFNWYLYILQASCYFANQGTSYIDCH